MYSEIRLEPFAYTEENCYALAAQGHEGHLKELVLGTRYRKILCGLTSPIRKLPIERLIVILDYDLGHDWNFLQPCVDSKSKYSSTIFSGASSFFRRLPQSPRAVKHSMNLKLLLQLLLRRSRECPLTINVIVQGFDSDFPAPAIKLLLMHCQCWWSFQYEGDFSTTIFEFSVLWLVKVVPLLKDNAVLEPFARAEPYDHGHLDNNLPLLCLFISSDSSPL